MEKKEINKLYKQNLLDYQISINTFTYLVCLVSAVGSILLLILFMTTKVWDKLSWDNILGLGQFMLATIIISSVMYVIYKKSDKHSKEAVKVFKYILIASSYINYYGIVKNMPYTEVWGIGFFSIFLSALYLEISTYAYSVTICVIINTVCYFTVPTYVPQGNLKGEFTLRVISLVFGIVGTYLTLHYSKKLLLRSSKSEYEVKQSFNNLKLVFDNVNQISQQVSLSSEQVATLSTQQNKSSEVIANLSGEVSVGATETVNSIKETSGLINQLMEGINNVLYKTNNSVEVSERLREFANEGKTSITSASNKIMSIKDSVSITSKSTKELEAKTKEIDLVVSFIKQISDQTNLLALNASIEAARAGEHGKGFGVVADEIRNLAEQSHNSLKTITKTLGEISEYGKRVDELMNRSVSMVEEGATIINKSSEYYQSIIENIAITKSSLHEVNSLSEEQLKQTKRVTQYIEAMSKIAKESAESVEHVASTTQESFAASEELLDTAHKLDNISKQLLKAISTDDARAKN